MILDELIECIPANQSAYSIVEDIAIKEWFDYYNLILKEYAGKEIVYIYVGDVEAILTPDNKVLSIQGIDLSDEIDADESDRYYYYFKYAQNTYIPE